MTADVTPTVRGDAALEEIQRLLDAGTLDRAFELLVDIHPADQADVLATIDPGARDVLAPRLSKEALAEILTFLEEEPRRHLTENLDPGVLGPVLDEADQDVAVDVLPRGAGVGVAQLGGVQLVLARPRCGRQGVLDDAVQRIAECGDVGLVDRDAGQHVGLVIVHVAVRAGLVDVEQVHG